MNTCTRQAMAYIRKHKIVTTVVLIVLVLISSNSGDGRLFKAQYSDSEYPILASCSGREEADLYEILPTDLNPGTENARDTVDVWIECYHDIVGVIIKEMMSEDHTKAELKKEAEEILDKCLRTTDYSAECDIDKEALEKNKGLDCRSESVEGLLKPSLTTARLACRLPPWENKKDLDDLSRGDTPTVLLEFLRTYECALTERRQFIKKRVGEDMRVHGFIKDDIMDISSVTTKDKDSAFDRELKDQKSKIENELDLSRPALNKALKIVSGIGKMHILEAEIECFQGVSLDLRNSFALGAETASCMPRVWDAQDSLRDSKE